MDFKNAKKWVIPEGEVSKLTINNVVVWLAKQLEHFASTTFPFTLVGAIAENLKQYLLYGNSVQNGTPTPETPIEIESVGDKTKNLLDLSKITTTTLDGITVEYKNNKIHIFGTPTIKSGYISLLFNDVFKADDTLKTYTMSRDKVINGIGFTPTEVLDANGNKSGALNFAMSDIVKKRTSTVIFNQKNMHLNIRYDIGTIDEYFGFQLEEGSQATPYEPYGYKIPVTVGGKNLFDKSVIHTGYRLNTTVSIGSVYGRVGSNYDFIADTDYCVSDLIEIEADKTYTKNTPADAYHRIHFYDKDKICIAVTNSSSVVSPDNAKYMAICMLTSEIDTIQLEEGTQATSYQPYVQPTTTNIYLDQPLRKIGEYADYIDFENQKVVRNIGENLIVGSDSTGFYQGTNALRMTIGKLQDTTKGDINILYASNSFTWGGFNSTTGLANTVTSGATATRCFLWFENGLFTDTTSARAYIDTLNIIVYNVLATPTEETIDLPPIPTIDGDTVIDITTKIKPSNMEGWYWKK